VPGATVGLDDQPPRRDERIDAVLAAFEPRCRCLEPDARERDRCEQRLQPAAEHRRRRCRSVAEPLERLAESRTARQPAAGDGDVPVAELGEERSAAGANGVDQVDELVGAESWCQLHDGVRRRHHPDALDDDDATDHPGLVHRGEGAPMRRAVTGADVDVCLRPPGNGVERGGRRAADRARRHRERGGHALTQPRPGMRRQGEDVAAGEPDPSSARDACASHRSRGSESDGLAEVERSVLTPGEAVDRPVQGVIGHAGSMHGGCDTERRRRSIRLRWLDLDHLSRIVRRRPGRSG
jgi:hypothetical protein